MKTGDKAEGLRRPQSDSREKDETGTNCLVGLGNMMNTHTRHTRAEVYMCVKMGRDNVRIVTLLFAFRAPSKAQSKCLLAGRPIYFATFMMCTHRSISTEVDPFGSTF